MVLQIFWRHCTNDHRRLVLPRRIVHPATLRPAYCIPITPLMGDLQVVLYSAILRVILHGIGHIFGWAYPVWQYRAPPRGGKSEGGRHYLRNQMMGGRNIPTGLFKQRNTFKEAGNKWNAL